MDFSHVEITEAEYRDIVERLAFKFNAMQIQSEVDASQDRTQDPRACEGLGKALQGLQQFGSAMNYSMEG